MSVPLPSARPRSRRRRSSQGHKGRQAGDECAGRDKGRGDRDRRCDPIRCRLETDYRHLNRGCGPLAPTHYTRSNTHELTKSPDPPPSRFFTRLSNDDRYARPALTIPNAGANERQRYADAPMRWRTFRWRGNRCFEPLKNTSGGLNMARNGLGKNRADHIGGRS